MNPIKLLDETQVSQEVIDRELEIERDILTKEGKPANIIDNILKENAEIPTKKTL